MRRALIGHNGFVGSNLKNQLDFNEVYNSKNIHEISNMVFDEIYFCGLPAEKWRINKDPETDLKNIIEVIGHLRKVRVNKIILISTIDIYQNLDNVDESSEISYSNHHSYGVNRRMFENFIKENYKNHHIIRLPGLFGSGLKKNIIYDFLTNNEVNKIDSRHIFQFYNLNDLVQDINIVLDNNIKEINFSTEPVSVNEVYFSLFNKPFKNFSSNPIIRYNVKSLYYKKFNGLNGYLRNKEEILAEIKKFRL